MSKIKKTKTENELPAKLSKPALRALHANAYYTLEDLSKITEKELSKLHGVGPNAIAEIKKALRRRKLFFVNTEIKN